MPLKLQGGWELYATLLALVILVLGILWDPLLGASQKGVNRFQSMPQPANGPVAELVEAVLDRTGYQAMLEDSPDLQDATRVENLQEMVSVARSASSACASSTLCCSFSVLRATSAATTPKIATRKTRSIPIRKSMNRVSGSSTTTVTSPARWVRKSESQNHHIPWAPSSMTLSTRPECVPTWNDCGSRRAWSK